MYMQLQLNLSYNYHPTILQSDLAPVVAIILTLLVLDSHSTL